MDDLFDVSGRVAIVTGGMGQLGRQFTLALARRGARVAVFDLRVDLDYQQQRFGEAQAWENLLFCPVDITDREAVAAGLAQVEAKWGPPQVLINNAGLDSPPNAPAAENGPFEDYPAASLDKVLDVNIKGVVYCCQVIGKVMAAQGKGSIINISSTYGLVSPDQRLYAYRAAAGAPFFKPVAYAISKSGLLNLTRYLATYWADRGVRVNTLTFGGVFNQQDADFLQGYCARVPLGRMANEDEYNGAILFLASDASSYMTGANLIIDGGWTAW